MSRYIDEEILIKKMFPYDIVDKRLYSINAKAIYEAIKSAPTADAVEVRHGVWVFGKLGGRDAWVCSLCGAGFTGENAEWIAKEHVFCPKCGAKMDGERIEHERQAD